MLYRNENGQLILSKLLALIEAGTGLKDTEAVLAFKPDFEALCRMVDPSYTVPTGPSTVAAAKKAGTSGIGYLSLIHFDNLAYYLAFTSKIPSNISMYQKAHAKSSEYGVVIDVVGRSLESLPHNSYTYTKVTKCATAKGLKVGDKENTKASVFWATRELVSVADALEYLGLEWNAEKWGDLVKI